jgi:3-isopropylmalate dehydrogenase
MRYAIAVIPGDGIGPEITEQAANVLREVGRLFGHSFDPTTVLLGGAAYDAAGTPFPEETLEICRRSDAVLLGAVGGAKWDVLPPSLRPEAGLLGLRKALGLYANIRPAVLYPALRDACPLRPDIVECGVDFVVVRELVGGIYFGKRGRRMTAKGEEAFDTERYADWEVARIARTAFTLARGRRRRVTSVDKANVLESSRLWREVVERTARDYPDVELDHLYVDNAAMQIIRDPSRFDVLLTTNMFGDILSDEASQITGSIGLLPSASLGDTTRGLYEPIHGSAPDIAGRGVANPLGAILSAAMMLRLSFGLEAEAAAVERAVVDALADGWRTPDIHRPGLTKVGTREMAARVLDHLAGTGAFAGNRSPENLT